jgi:hypothetical protein
MVLEQEYSNDLGLGNYYLSQKYLIQRKGLVTSAVFVPSPVDTNTGSLEDLYFPKQQTVVEHGGEPALLQDQGEIFVPEDTADQEDYSDYSDKDYIFLWPWVEPLVSKTAEAVEERQSPLLANPLFLEAVARIGVVLALVLVGTQLSNWLVTPYLRNQEMCGITTGGQVRRGGRLELVFY